MLGASAKHGQRGLRHRAQCRPGGDRALAGVAGDERLNDRTVELLSGFLSENVDRLPVRSGRPVRSHAGDRVEGVGDRDDPRAERDLLAGETVRVSGSV